MKNHIFGKSTRMVVLMVGFLLGTMLLAPVAYGKDTIKIGVIVPLSGAAALMGDLDVKHFEMLADKINAKGGILGKKVEFKLYDNKNSPNDTIFQMKRAISDGVRILMQCHSSGCTAALNEAVRKYNARNPDNRVILLVWDTTDPSFNNSKCNFWMFHFGQNAQQRSEALVQYVAADKNIKKVYLINQDYAHGHACSKAMKDALKHFRPDIKIVGDELHPVLKVKDFSPYINAIRASGADAVLTSSWGMDLILLVKEAYKSGLKAQFVTIYAGVPGVPTALQEAGKGTVQLTEWHMNYKDADNPTSKFALEFKKRYKTDFYYQDVNTMMSMLKKAIEKTKSTKPIDIAYALEGMKVMTPTGEYVMRAKDHQAIAPQIVSVFTRKVKHDVENTGLGWKTVMEIPPIDVPTTCKMKRPGRKK